MTKNWDGGRPIDWGKTSEDYGRLRPGPPPSFYKTLQAHGVGEPGQRIVDIGTGTGVLARQFAAQGAIVSAADIADGQIAMARTLAEEAGLEVDFRVAPGEETGFPAGEHDVVTASQCWIYFDLSRIRAEIRRLLKPGGKLVISHFNFLPREDAIVAASEALVLKHNPDWAGADWHGNTPFMADIGINGAHLAAFFRYDEQIPFTRESWKGRMRALRGTGATLDPAALQAFDAEHDQLLRDIAPDAFTILHRIDAHILQMP